MKYRDENGDFKEVYFKATDTLPIGAEVDFDGEEIPYGWEEVSNPDPSSTIKIRKTDQVVGVVGNVLNTSSLSEKDTYSCDYLNNVLAKIRELDAGYDIDDLVVSGFHLYAVSNATGTLPTGYTSTNSFIIQTYLSGSTDLIGKQILMDTNSDRLFVRTRNVANSTWNSWVEVNTNIKISSGTSNPSGGNDGDIYFKYS